jgi:short-subunit dehydrogenase
MNTIVITGAHGDIGNAILSALRAPHTRLIGVVRDEATAKEVGQAQGIETVIADLGSYDALLQLPSLLPETFDWLITAHGYIDPCTNPLQALPQNTQQTFMVNALSQMYLVQLTASQLTRGMVCISSTAGIHANGKVLAYSASKAAANALMQGLARNIESKTFIALCPGPTLGRMRESIGASGGQPPELVGEACLKIIEGSYETKSGDIITVKDGALETVARI